jgi:hypothetical protein
MKSLFLSLTALALLGGGCDSGGGASKQEKAAIRAVAASFRPGRSLTEQFPASPKSVRCTLNMGGPHPGIRVPGTCATIVTIAPDGSAVVRFKETWDSHDFIVNARPRGELSHTWDFTVTKAGRISSARDYGAVHSVP